MYNIGKSSKKKLLEMLFLLSMKITPTISVGRCTVYKLFYKMRFFKINSDPNGRHLMLHFLSIIQITHKLSFKMIIPDLQLSLFQCFFHVLNM